MSVALKISVTENCSSLWLFDRTGKYDPKCNPGGWCPPNQNIEDATRAEFHLYPPKTDQPIILDVYPSFPTMEKEGYEVLPEDIGADKFVSGMWRFDYFVWVNGEMLQGVSCQKLLVEDIKCCINGKQVDVNTDNFDSKEVKEFNEVYNLFKGAKSASKSGKVSEAQKIIDFLYKRCKCKC